MYSTTMRAEVPSGVSLFQRAVSSIRSLLGRVHMALNFAAPIGDFLLRLWVAAAFFQSGLVKIQSVETTIQLFEYEYHVPVLPPAVAAYMSMAGELGFSTLLVLGLLGRLSAIGLFFVNIVAVISYPELMAAGLEMHLAWGLVLLTFALRGPGKLSLDQLIGRRFGWL